MTRAEIKEFVGQYGMIEAGSNDFRKTLHGYVKDVDVVGKTWFMDNDQRGHAFPCDEIVSFEVKEFESLPKEYKGKEVYWNGGVAYYTGTTKEVDLKK